MTFARINLKNSSLWLALLLGIFLYPLSSKAITLDWNSVAWTAGSLSQSFDIDASNAGNDITITISGNTSRLRKNTPVNDTTLTGGFGAAEKSLLLDANAFADATEFITVTITFNYAQGVNHVNFWLFDVDTGGVNVFQDQIRNIVGHNGATNSAAFLTGSLDNRVDGTGTTQTITGTNANAGTATSDGNALINFGNSVLTSVTFDYGNRPGNGTVNSEQFIGLHDIRYGLVPEVNPAWGALAVCGLAIGARIRRRTKTAPAIPAL